MYCGMWFNDIKCYILALKKQKPQIVQFQMDMLFLELQDIQTRRTSKHKFLYKIVQGLVPIDQEDSL